MTKRSPPGKEGKRLEVEMDTVSGNGKEKGKGKGKEKGKPKKHCTLALGDEGEDEIEASDEKECLKPSNGEGAGQREGRGAPAKAVEWKRKEQDKEKDKEGALLLAKRQSLLLKRGDTDLSIDRTGLQRFLPQCMQFAFADRDAEQLYREYYENEKRSDFKILVIIVLVINAVLLLLYSLSFSSHKWPQIVVLLLTLCVAAASLVVSVGKKGLSASARVWAALPFLMWLVQMAHLFCDLWLYSIPRMPCDSVPWVLLYTYSIYVIFPLRLRFCCLLALALALLHLAFVGISPPKREESFTRQIGANLLLFLSVNLLGTMSFFFYERQQRRAFLETCQSLEAKLVLEEESQEQERLLLSVLPQHVASEIRQDLGAVVTGQFKKIYMSRHENVSILFADIVGFTAISSTCPAAELVRTLNELFARFDKLAEKYHQLRIKILGDCYYCISGAPEERPDHAVLCVHMGLSMVEAIKSVREQTKSGVDMRVGIHTGGVLAGVLGQKQWQFDVYSRDVELANKMESGGLPGRVHISEKTHAFLKGEFEVSEGDGASREEAIRLSGVKTYFIVRVLKPYPEGTLDALKPTDVPEETQENSEQTESIIGPGGEIKNIQEYNKRLRYELLNRENSEQFIRKHTSLLTVTFSDQSYEHQYRYTRDITSCVSLLGLPLTLLCSFMAYLLVGPMRLVTYLVFILSNSILITMAIICTAPTICNAIPKPLASISQAVQERAWIRLVISGSMIVIWLTAHIIANVFCEESEPSNHMNSHLNLSKSLPNEKFQHVLVVDSVCPLPQYLVYFSIIGMLGVTVLTRISHLMKIIVIFTVVVVQCCLSLLKMFMSFKWYDVRIYENDYRMGHDITLSIIAVTAALVLFIINRQFELMSRRLFLWQKEVEEQKEQVSDMRRKNEALVYNILPPHVAIHFLGRRKKDEELYSKSYETVGVLFAAMPNFSDFYTEESVNNQGLECLRFLNEVISDYDALLEQARFKDIIKIKTIGATYMAASGLNSDDCVKGDPPREKWRHLAQLTEFALALKETLNNINKESFNNFVLRMVNVASRMESTGKAGCIQVVQETSEILEEFGYTFEQRGLVSVKGKGMLRTFYLISGPR